jgi:hypothetical protein
MKTLFCLVAAAALMCGCNSKPDPKVAELERRIDSLEKLNQKLDEREETIFEMATNTQALTMGLWGAQFTAHSPMDVNTGLPIPIGARTDALAERIDTISETLSNLILTLNAAHPGAVRQAYMPAQTSPPAPGQMPADVAAKIRATAAEEFPNNYDMQVFAIKHETDAWYKLHQ